LHSQHALNGMFSARDIVAMATRDAARILKWDKKLRSIEVGKRADMVVIKGASKDAYDAIINAVGPDVELVMIKGVARCGTAALMAKLAASDQTMPIGGSTRALFLKQDSADPDVAQVPSSTAVATLREAVHDIATLATEIEKPR